MGDASASSRQRRARRRYSSGSRRVGGFVIGVKSNVRHVVPTLLRKRKEIPAWCGCYLIPKNCATREGVLSIGKSLLGARGHLRSFLSILNPSDRTTARHAPARGQRKVTSAQRYALSARVRSDRTYSARTCARPRTHSTRRRSGPASRNPRALDHDVGLDCVESTKRLVDGHTLEGHHLR